METLVQIVKEEPRVSHRVIAENTNNKQININKLINENLLDFQEFGEVQIIEKRVQTAGGKQKQKTFWLNEAQATLLMTYLRNNDVVKRFKKSLVKEFFDMREKLYNPNIYELSGRVGGLTTANYKLRSEVKKLKRKLNNRVDALEDDVNDLKSNQKLLPLKNLDEKLEVLFKKSDMLLDKESTGFTEVLQKHLRFYREYVEVLQQDGNKIQTWATNEIEKSKKKYLDTHKDVILWKYKYEILMKKVEILQNNAEDLINFDIEKEMELIEIS